MATYIVDAVTFAVVNLVLNVLFVWVFTQVRVVNGRGRGEGQL